MILFDFDGTLVDSNGVWEEVDNTFLARRGLTPTQEYSEMVGHSIFPLAAQFTIDYYHLDTTPQAIMDEWTQLGREAYGLRTARRLIRPSGYRLTVRFGAVYTLRIVPQRQPHTPAQLTARAIFAEANRLAVNELKNTEHRAYWQREALRLGYRTAIGACRAYHVRRLRESRCAPALRNLCPVQTTLLRFNKPLRRCRSARPTVSLGIPASPLRSCFMPALIPSSPHSLPRAALTVSPQRRREPPRRLRTSLSSSRLRPRWCASCQVAARPLRTLTGGRITLEMSTKNASMPAG